MRALLPLLLSVAGLAFLARLAAPGTPAQAGAGTQPAPAAPAAQAGAGAPGDVRQQVIDLALAQVGKPYILGTEGPDTFDCSGLVQWVYAHVGVETTRTTFTQLDALPAVAADALRPGDMVYFQYPWDQHTGILADLDGDGAWDMIHAGSPEVGVLVTYGVFADPFYADAIIGYRTALGGVE